MATYNGTMSVDGSVPYSNTAGGYQIGGADIGSAWCTITLPDTYSAYNVCSLTCALYSRTAPSNWLSTWTCDIKITIKAKLALGKMSLKMVLIMAVGLQVGVLKLTSIKLG